MYAFLKILGDILRDLLEAFNKPLPESSVHDPAPHSDTDQVHPSPKEKTAVSSYNYVPQEEKKMYAVRDINVRIGAPNLTVASMPAAKGKIFVIAGYVINGEEINDNSLWFKDADGNYIWSANLRPLEFERVLNSPLKNLICTQEFAERPEVYKDYGSPKGHNGLDFRTWVDGDWTKWEQAVFAVLDGKISEADFDPKYKGNFVRIVHTNACESVYLHLSKLNATKGQIVRAGDQIGVSGNSGGASEAPHLHFGYRPVNHDVNDGFMGYINPAPLFKEEIKYV